MSRDNWARLVEAVVRREEIWQMFHDHSRSPSISTIASDQDDDPINHFSGQLTNDSFKALSVSPPVSLRKPVVSQTVSNNAGSTGPFQRKLFSSWYRRRKPKDRLEFDMGHDVRRFSKSEIQAALHNFGEKNRLIQPGFHEVHKGRLSDGSVVAIKRYKQGTRQVADLQFQIEVEVVGMVVHPNIIHLLGYCITPKERMLIYPLMVHGSVASCLRERPLSQAPLNWSIRKRIALGSAKGLAYLHDKCDPKIIHRDVKAANILLDEDFNAVVADFDMAILMHHNDSHVTTAVRGTIGHMAPEYISTGICTEKIDVFGYGVFLLELITGQRAFVLARLANEDDLMLFDWVKTNLLEKTWRRLMDPDCEAGGDLMEEEVEQVIQLALMCTQTDPMGRPKMSEIVRMLEDGSGLVERWIQCQEEEEERLRNELITSSNMYWPAFEDEISNIPPDELSGPR